MALGLYQKDLQLALIGIILMRFNELEQLIDGKNGSN